MLIALATPLLLVQPGSAQQAGPGGTFKPASSNVPGQEYPQIDAQLRAYFRVRAPDAKQVQVDVGGARHDMVQGADSTWTVTTPPLAPGFHYYSIIVGGASVADPNSETFFGVSRMMSGIEVPSAGEDFYGPKDVPHGEVREKWYYSPLTKAWRRAFIYTPPGYDTSPGTRYPVLYLQHGAGEDERGWHVQGHMSFILDNLFAAGQAVPMIVVMDNGGGSAAFARPRPAAPPAGVMGAPAAAAAPGQAAGQTRPAQAAAGQAAPGQAAAGQQPAAGAAAATARPPQAPNPFEQVLLTEIIPMVDRSYRTVADRDHRAIAGLSMGAGQAFTIGFGHLDTFAWIGAFSGGGARGDLKTAYNGVFADPGALNQKLKTLFISIGTTENVANARRFHASLDSIGVKHVYYESEGTAHEWQTWRRSLHQFAPLLFKNVARP
ncbi:MAG: esterase [Gemmatimonadetes bacterium]|nr:esterase [Gemmatimonadota bacterium]